MDDIVAPVGDKINAPQPVPAAQVAAPVANATEDEEAELAAMMAL